MRDGSRVSVIIPALNEARSIGRVLDAIPTWVDEIIVADNGSNDGTPDVAAKHGARVVHEPRRGYGSACLKAIAALDRPDVVVFLDADFSDHPEQMDRLVDPIVHDGVDLVIGSRMRGQREPGALTPQARFGNRLACALIRLFWGVQFTDLGPFRAIRYTALQRLGMRDPDYGWTVEMQIEAVLHGLAITEAPVDYRRRVGRSKVSGTLRGIVGAGYKILGTIFLSALRYHLGRQRKVSAHRTIMIFTRYPDPGATKTRLIPALGPDGAADLQRQLTEHALRQAAQVPGARCEVHYTGTDEPAMREWLGDAVALAPQIDGDLGRRMAAAFRHAFDAGADAAVIIGIDSPDIGPETHEAAFDSLRRNDVVLGPATDGGYYLVGLRSDAARRALPQMFDGIDWSTDRVFVQTIEKLDALGLRAARLAPLDDIDRPEDLAVWQRHAEPPPAKPFLSVIIPALNEADRIGPTLDALGKSDDVEAIVIDGGSTDDTAAIAQRHGARVFAGPRGRADQMNFGSAKAAGEVLMFLHADTRLPPGYGDHIRAGLAAPRAIAGAFRFATDLDSPSMRLVERIANLRSRRLQLPYGDQAFFLRKETFRRLSGFKSMPLMEDFEFARRLKRHGRIAIVPATSTTCGRRWRELGVWRTTLRNQFIVLLYCCGVPAERLAAYYRRGTG